jgi:ArsR family transcriptional regulator
MQELDKNTVIRILKALSDETRLSIVRKLARNQDATCSHDVVSCSSVPRMSQPTMSHHFKKLVDAGVVIEEKRGTQKTYRLAVESLALLGIDIYKL